MRHLLGFTSLISLLLLLSPIGCAKSDQHTEVFGESPSDVEIKRGKPEQINSVSDIPSDKIYDYRDGCSVQYRRNVSSVLVACPPTSDEVTLQYWRHKWKGTLKRFEELPGSADSHGKKTFQLISEKNKISVIYDETTDRVVRVVTYGSN